LLGINAGAKFCIPHALLYSPACRVLAGQIRTDAVKQLIATRGLIEHIDFEHVRSVKKSANGKYPSQFMFTVDCFAMLLMRSNSPVAAEFQRWIAERILLPIHRCGAYITPRKISEIRNDPEAMPELLRQLEQFRLHQAALEGEIAELRRQQASLAPKACYVATTRRNALVGEIKLGCARCPYARLSSLNTSHTLDDSLALCRVIWTSDNLQLERLLHDFFAHYRISEKREWFRIPYDVLMRELDFIEMHLETLHTGEVQQAIALRIAELPQTFPPDTVWTRGLNMSIFSD
jgi:hypothetical protein